MNPQLDLDCLRTTVLNKSDFNLCNTNFSTAANLIFLVRIYSQCFDHIVYSHYL